MSFSQTLVTRRNIFQVILDLLNWCRAKIDVEHGWYVSRYRVSAKITLYAQTNNGNSTSAFINKNIKL